MKLETVKMGREAVSKKGHAFYFGFFLISRLLLSSSLLFTSCAKHETGFVKKMLSDIGSFRGLAYVVAEKDGIKWASNASIVIKAPSMLRIDALERVGDIAATLYADGDKGYLGIEASKKKYPLKDSYVRLPAIGEVPIKTGELADILTGRPVIEGGVKEISDSFMSSYFVKGRVEDIEMSSGERMPLSYTRYTSEEKRHVLFEAGFDDFVMSGGRKFPRHIVLRFERPRLWMEIKYKEIKNEK